MKLVNAIKHLEENKLTFKKENVNNNYSKYIVEYNGYLLTFFDNKTKDAENFYVVKEGKDDGYNGYNGEFFKNLTSAVKFLKLQKQPSRIFDNSNAHLL